jgi:hypothetical protein
MLTQLRHFYSRALRYEKHGGFSPRFPLYPAETHDMLCSSQKKGAAQMEQHKNQKIQKEKYL